MNSSNSMKHSITLNVVASKDGKSRIILQHILPSKENRRKQYNLSLLVRKKYTDKRGIQRKCTSIRINNLLNNCNIEKRSV